MPRDHKSLEGDEALKNAYRAELVRAGEARQAALHQAESQLERLSDLLPGATQAGISVTEVARLTNVSRPTVYELLRASDGEPDVAALILASVVQSPKTKADLAEITELPPTRLVAITADLTHRGWLELVPAGGERSDDVYLATQNGENALATWTFPDEIDERATRTLRLAIDAMRFSPEDRSSVNRKIARARAQGKERLGLLEAMRMGVESELKAWRDRGLGREKS
jgi:hypothetical protein